MQIRPDSNSYSQPFSVDDIKQPVDMAETAITSILDEAVRCAQIPVDQMLLETDAIFKRVKDQIDEYKKKNDHQSEIERISNELKNIPCRTVRNEFSLSFLSNLLDLGLKGDVLSGIDSLLDKNGYKVFLSLCLLTKEEGKWGKLICLQHARTYAKNFDYETPPGRELMLFIESAFLLGQIEFDLGVKLFSKLPDKFAIRYLEMKKTDEEETNRDLAKKILAEIDPASSIGFWDVCSIL